MNIKALHLSRARGSADGGVSIAVGDLLHHQQSVDGLTAHWCTASDDCSLSDAVRDLRPHLIHIHGLWSQPNRLGAKLQGRIPLVIAPHGMLDPWAFSHHRRRKRLLWWLYEQRCLQSCSSVHALCPSEVGSLRDLGLQTPIALIPNGVDLSATQQPIRDSFTSSLPPVIPTGANVLLFLSRFHKKKGLQPLLQAWQALSSVTERNDWWLALVGYGDGGELERQVATAQARGELPRVCVCGPVFGVDKSAVFAASSAFVLPSYSEGLPMAALEAMAHRLPCLLSTACNIPEAFDSGAALAAEPEPDLLAASLCELFALTEADRSAMGAAGNTLVAQRFSWSRVAEQTHELYHWILGGGDRPGFVDLH
jgi:glycosyltransferase involved in cell wall biosynthesis